MSWLGYHLTQWYGVVLTSWIAPFSLLYTDRRQAVNRLNTTGYLDQTSRQIVNILVGILYVLYYFMWIIYLSGGRTCFYTNNAYTCDSVTTQLFPLAWLFINYIGILATVLSLRPINVKRQREKRTMDKKQYELVSQNQ